MSHYVVITHGPGTGTRFELHQDVTRAGSLPASGIPLPLSPPHAFTVCRRGENWSIINRCNERLMVGAHVLLRGDSRPWIPAAEVTCGQLRLKLQSTAVNSSAHHVPGTTSAPGERTAHGSSPGRTALDIPQPKPASGSMLFRTLCGTLVALVAVVLCLGGRTDPDREWRQQNLTMIRDLHGGLSSGRLTSDEHLVAGHILNLLQESGLTRTSERDLAAARFQLAWDTLDAHPKLRSKLKPPVVENR